MEKTKSKKRGKKVIIIVLLIILFLVLFITVIISVNSKKNMKQVDLLVEESLAEISKHYKVTPASSYDYETVKVNPLMNFDIDRYEIEGIGNMSVMTVNAGFMQMASIIITPRDKNIPMLSTDFMYILSNRKDYVEYYDLVEDKEDPEYKAMISELDALRKDIYSRYTEVKTEPRWYTPLADVTVHISGKPADDEGLRAVMTDNIKAYLEISKNFEPISGEEREAKLRITKEYSDRLVDEGGISTDAFKKKLGPDTTKDFFDHVLFGTAE